MRDPFETQLTPNQLRISAILKQYPERRAALLDQENLAAGKKDLEPDAIKIFLATRTILTANDSKLFAAAVYHMPRQSETYRAITLNLELNENLASSYSKAVSWALGTLNKSLPIRLYTSAHVDLQPSFVNLTSAHLSDRENPAYPMLQNYIRETHMF